jgi:hypothetical protein
MSTLSPKSKAVFHFLVVTFSLVALSFFVSSTISSLSTAEKRLRVLAEMKPSSGPTSLVSTSSLDLGLLHAAAADDLVDHQLAILRLVAAEGLAHRLAVGRGDDVGHAGDGVVLLEALHALHDALRLLDDFGHELLAGSTCCAPSGGA